jgi:hypothetical protein
VLYMYSNPGLSILDLSGFRQQNPCRSRNKTRLLFITRTYQPLVEKMRRQVAAWLGSGKFQACWSIGSRCASSASITLPEIDYTPPVYSGPSKEEVLRLREKYLNPGLS